MLSLLAIPGPLRRFLLASLQSGVGNGVGYVALVLLAYEQSPTPWAVTAVLMAEFVPAILLGSVFGVLADRHDHRRLMVLADVVRAVGFAGLAVSPSFSVTLVLAVAVGCAQALYQPASKAALPSLAGRRVEDAMGLLVLCTTISTMAGPAIGAALLLVASTSSLLMLNAVSFGASAVILVTLPHSRSAAGHADASVGIDGAAPSGGFREGLRVLREVPGLPVVVFAAVAGTLTAAMINVGEPILARTELGATGAEFAALVAVFGLGSTSGAAAGRAATRRMFVGMGGMAASLAMTAVVASVEAAFAVFFASGVFAGLMVASEHRLMATMVPPAIQGRAYGLKDSMESFAFVAAYVIGGAIAAAAGSRWVFAIGAIATAGVLSVALRVSRRRSPAGHTAPVSVPDRAPPDLVRAVPQSLTHRPLEGVTRSMPLRK